MLTHTHKTPQNPPRVVLLGGSGFFGRALAARLKTAAVEVVAPRSADLDLCAPEAPGILKALLQPEDSLVVFAALTPDRGRGIDTFQANITMAANICEALAETPVAHVVYFSSDAVYPLAGAPVNEDSPAAPGDLYGAMHLARELMFRQTVGDRLCVLRPSLVYGARDTHNSYGPNRFRRQAAKEGKIVIGGEGEETRDHVYIDDVAHLTHLVLTHGSRGVLNLATGRSTDFGTVARLVAGHFAPAVPVCPTPRNMPATHRHFDVTALHQAFPGYTFTPLEIGLGKAHEAD